MGDRRLRLSAARRRRRPHLLHPPSRPGRLYPPGLGLEGHLRRIQDSVAWRALQRKILKDPVLRREINDLLKAGADEFIKKPFNIEKVIEKIGELLAV